MPIWPISVRAFVITALCMAVCQAAVHAQIADPIVPKIQKAGVQIELETVATGLTAPNLLLHARDGTDRLFVVDQSGQVRIIKNGVLQNDPFLDVSDRLVPLGFFGTQDPFTDFDERGLLGLAFHPGFSDAQSAGFGKVYTYTSEPGSDQTFPGGPNHVSHITEWQVDAGNPDLIDVTTRRDVLTVDEPQFNHNAGMLAFGPDGYLYIALGDGGQADDQGTGHNTTIGNAQDLSNVLGSILRIDPLAPGLTVGSPDPISSNGKYRNPADNPFIGDPNPGTAIDETRDEIFAYGLRNPFRFSFDVDPLTGAVTQDTSGRLVVADVGQNHIEEVNLVVAGGNYGWRVKEGTFLFDPNGGGSGFVTADSPGTPVDLIDPVLQYDHDEAISVIGGFVYRGSAIPQLVGKYVFGDFSTGFFAPDGRLFYGDLDTGELHELILGLDDRSLGLFVKGFGQDADGELYVLAGPNLGPFGNLGAVYKIVAIPEPGTILTVLGAGVLVIVRRRVSR